ncbi:ammonium transporter [Caldithrix abyssi]|uniref:Ammonium transporter n=1 Tax=Caldithrix abyssi DSM 13497 TaxID=880073 RepID=H1XV27_CALAY|nr:ammonium transporter [Caldithrix abyssi]APF18898.1 ammonium transporter [Caldithrix abyssi DSM 13497]EHO42860.1 ammonium transporter [Caldithrix abyssi DSM 13497]
MRTFVLILIILLISVGSAKKSYAVEPNEKETIEQVSEHLQNNLNIVWTSMAAFLVFFMQAGFAMVESGFTQAKNTVNIMMKNLMDFSISSLAFFLIGFGLMFGKSNGLVGTSHFALLDLRQLNGDWIWTFFMFQIVFAGTAATIVSGAMAERTRFIGYLSYSLFISAFIYPVFGSWVWGSLLDGAGWLEKLGFIDFAGSTVVHSIGGWLALAGAIMVGPRIGKYAPDGKAQAIPGHNIALAALGVFILWFGWFGFNAGSTTFGDGNIGRIAVTTNLAAAAGALSAMVTAWMKEKKPDGSMTLNGALAGLVAITAGCATVTPLGSMIIGAIAGVVVVLSVLFFDRVLKIDDPVGAISVHGVCGALGTIFVGFFAVDGGLFYGGGWKLLNVQILGASVAFIWAFGLGIILFLIIKKTIGLRVTAEEELRGLDIGEHGMEAYSGFQIFTTR